MTPAEQFVREVEALGGKLWLMGDGSLLCQNVPRSFEPRLEALESEVFALLRLLDSPPEPNQLDKRKLRKLIKTIQDAGGEFHRSPSGRFFDYIKLPEQLIYRQLVLDNAMAIFPLVFPPPKRSSARPRRPKCSICLRDGSDGGCRTLGRLGTRVPCKLCGHDCWNHFGPERDYPLGGCNVMIPDRSAGTKLTFQPAPRCQCPGWPVASAPTKTRKKKNTLFNFETGTGLSPDWLLKSPGV
jgi:hypothetical protein